MCIPCFDGGKVVVRRDKSHRAEDGFDLVPKRRRAGNRARDFRQLIWTVNVTIDLMTLRLGLKPDFFIYSVKPEPKVFSEFFKPEKAQA
jgi:hypothetical protein